VPPGTTAWTAPGWPTPPVHGHGGPAEDLSVPRRLHPVTPVLDLVVQIRQLALPIVILALGGAQGAIGVGTIVLIMGLVLGLRILRWTRYSYRIDGDALRIEEGVLRRTRRTVPLARIQQVDVQRALRHRVAGVAALRVDTAGGAGGAEATLDVIALDEAERLRRVLLAARDRAQGLAAADSAATPTGTGTAPAGPEVADDDPTVSAGPPPAEGEPDGIGAARPGEPPAQPWAGPEDEGDVVLTIPARRLAVGGMTGARLAAVLIVVGSALRLLDDLPEGLARDVLDAVPTGGTILLLLVMVGLPLSLVVAAVSAMLSDGGFTLTARRGALHVRRGVLDQREATVGLHRVQAVRIEQNPVRRLLGLAQVQLQSAGSGTSASGDVTRVTVPVVQVRDLDALLGRVLPGVDALPELAPAPPAARRRAMIRRVVPTALVFGFLPLLSDPRPVGVAIYVGLLVAALLLGEAAYRGLGHAAVDGHVVARRGTLTRETVVVPVARTQSTRLRSSPLQRRARLASLYVDVAGRGRTPAIIDGPAPRLAELRTAVLGTDAARADEAAVRRRARAA
jgi:putative membrane protein